MPAALPSQWDASYKGEAASGASQRPRCSGGLGLGGSPLHRFGQRKKVIVKEEELDSLAMTKGAR